MDDPNPELPRRGNPTIRPRRSQKAKGLVCKIHPDTRDTIQKGFLTPIFTLSGQGRGRVRDERGPRRDLWQSLRSTLLSTQARPSRVLLADDVEGCNLLYSRLRQVPEIWKPHPFTTGDTYPNDGTLAVRPMGSGHHGTPPGRTKAAEIPCCWN
jgi:hypothetical protein